MILRFQSNHFRHIFQVIWFYQFAKFFIIDFGQTQLFQHVIFGEATHALVALGVDAKIWRLSPYLLILLIRAKYVLLRMFFQFLHQYFKIRWLIVLRYLNSDEWQIKSPVSLNKLVSLFIMEIARDQFLDRYLLNDFFFDDLLLFLYLLL